MADPALLATSGHWIHDLSPFAITFGADFGIRWYGLAYLAGIAWGMWMFVRWSRVGRFPLNSAQIQDFVLWAGLGMIIGGRFGYCLFYGWDELIANPIGRWVEVRTLMGTESRFEWPYLIRVWEGGMASHGGILGMLAGTVWFARRHQVAAGVLADAVAAVAPMGIMLGRAANFVNGELWGRPSEVAWAVIFKHAPRVDGVMVARHPSQLYEAFAEGLLLLVLMMPIHARHRRPWLTCGVLLSAYAVVRVICEIFREPDIGQPVFFGLISKGQAFSLPVLMVGLGLWLWALRRPALPGAYSLPVKAAIQTPP